MTPKIAFQTSHPEAFFLDAADLPALEAYLRRLGWVGHDEPVLAAAPAGEGNMNYTLRVRTPRRSLIVKQARPWVEKYPSIAAPWDRALVEAEFYQTVERDAAVARCMPRLLGADPASRTLMLEDCGDAPDFTSLYRDGAIEEQQIQWLTDFLARLHSQFRDTALAERFDNREMRLLNHEHIFRFPLLPFNGLDLDAITPGLQALARKLQNEKDYAERVYRLGEVFLHEGRCLLHGDYFPGSWLRTSAGVKIVDPEFCLFGVPEWDVGVMLAHLELARCPAALAQDVLARYCGDADAGLTRQFAGVEIMRRLIGVAQLPLPYGLPEKTRLLDLSYQMVMKS